MKKKVPSSINRLAVLALGILAILSTPVRAEGIFIQDYLPKEWKDKIKVSVESRYRLEAKDDFDFNQRADDTDTFHLLRMRLNLDAAISDDLRGFLQLQDSRIFDSTSANRFSTAFRDEMDIRQAYLDIKNLFKGLTIRGGRQELLYGDQRLVGGFDWSNVTQSFDALKAIYAFNDKLTIDGFLSQKVNIDRSNPNNLYDDNEGFHGLYAAYKGIDKHILDLYYLYRNTSEPLTFGPSGLAKINESTIGFRLKGEKLNGFDYTFEPMYQFGKFGSRDINAYAVVALGGYTFDKLAWKPRVGLEWNFASGDESSTDSERNTFDNLWPTNHLFYGYMDLVSLQNINAYHLTADIKPNKKLTLQGDYWVFYLDETTDAAYNAARGQLRAAKPGATSGLLGSEIDLLVKYGLNKNVSLLGGVSHFFAGKFLAQSGANDDADYFYLQSALKF
ncbi:MAG: alginate export family protein [Candidatus Omnitrophota bacterium]